MRTSRHHAFRSLAVVALVAATCAPALGATSIARKASDIEPRLTFNADNAGNAARVTLTDGLGNEVAAVLEAGRRSAVDAATGAPVVSTRLLARLRDAALASAAPNALPVAEWLMALMGPSAQDDLQDIPANATTRVMGKTTTRWCGKGLTVKDTCPSDCTPSDNPGTCSGCGCSGESVTDGDLRGGGPPLQRVP